MEMRGIEPRTFHMLSEHYTTKPHPQVDISTFGIYNYEEFSKPLQTFFSELRSDLTVCGKVAFLDPPGRSTTSKAIPK